MENFYGKRLPGGSSKMKKTEMQPDQSSSKNAVGIDPTELFPEEVKQAELFKHQKQLPFLCYFIKLKGLEDDSLSIEYCPRHP